MTRVTVAALLTVVVLLGTGCGRKRDLDRPYGRSYGASINGVRVFSDLLAGRGHDVKRVSSFDRRVLEDADVLVVVAPDPAPLELDQVFELEDWLTDRPDRTLLFVAYDFDADVHLFDDLRAHMAAGGEEALELQAEARRKLALYELRKQSMPIEPGAPLLRYPFARDDVADPDAYPAPLDPGSMAEAAARAGRPRVYLRRYPAPLAADPGDAAPEDARRRDPMDTVVSDPVSREETWLASEGRALVSVRVLPVGDGGESRAILLANASFLLNYSLMDPAHRALAGQLEEALTPGSRVVFFEPSPGRPRGGWFLGHDPVTMPNPLEALLRPPMGWVFLHFLIAGLLLLLARSVFLGRARSEPEDPAIPFADHVRAYGRLLEASGDRAHADALIEEYRSEVHRGDARRTPHRAGR